MTLPSPDVIGSYTVDDKMHFYASRRSELDRAGVNMVRTLKSFGFQPGSVITNVSLTPEVVQFAPFEYAVQILGMYGTNADLSPYDAGRVESLSRQFDPVAIMGVGMDTLEGLKMMGHEAATVFKGRTIWARPDAYDAVVAMPGVFARRCVLAGPVLLFECANGNLHLDAREWIGTCKENQLRLTSRQIRAEPVSDLATGISAQISDQACSCGNHDTIVDLL
ncbi:MAG TPA: hypothetical protein DHV57_11290 [Hyphomonas sp.]|uniref:hypothetical protein n=1 Tax=Hyphomonas sp. UBA5107 TaxID=1946636 RepID=UPI000C5D29EA|nr:hypothetical protein [Hyphomonas sp. UBA5107]MAA83008.1 hypothetical protein [Hyphomonas sp.]HBL92030.1 hypothetical protein [Hyphomonas sp.]HCJ17990.1 hypothetical protein [Hyphomonas sp.]HCN93690.1 hypothetical protein [Hyphomonas sp.]|tara:strand:- start:321 stop:986 length:666 start_codon:yes stop_codon:yes gene_type:complete